MAQQPTSQEDLREDPLKREDSPKLKVKDPATREALLAMLDALEANRKLHVNTGEVLMGQQRVLTTLTRKVKLLEEKLELLTPDDSTPDDPTLDAPTSQPEPLTSQLGTSRPQKPLGSPETPLESRQGYFG